MQPLKKNRYTSKMKGEKNLPSSKFLLQVHALSLNDTKLGKACTTLMTLNQKVVTRSTDGSPSRQLHQMRKEKEEGRKKKGNDVAIPQSFASDVGLVVMKHTWPEVSQRKAGFWPSRF